MNQVLKENVYKLGNNEHVEFIADLSGMDEEEKILFMYLHKGYSDLTIQNEMSLSRKAYDRIERTVRTKLTLGIFQCINIAMDSRQQE